MDFFSMLIKHPYVEKTSTSLHKPFALLWCPFTGPVLPCCLLVFDVWYLTWKVYKTYFCCRKLRITSPIQNLVFRKQHFDIIWILIWYIVGCHYNAVQCNTVWTYWIREYSSSEVIDHWDLRQNINQSVNSEEALHIAPSVATFTNPSVDK